MSLIDLYVAEVGRHLSGSNRADLEKEIRSLLEDAVEGAVEEQGRPRTRELESEVLKKFGSPAQVAASYEKPRYLIGPRLYPTFLTVLRITLTVVLIVFAVIAGLGLAQGVESGEGPLQTILDAVGSMFSAMIATVGWMVIVFALLERFLPEKDLPIESWDPSQLKAEPDKERVGMVEPIVGIVFTLLALLILNVYPQWIGLFSRVDGEWVYAPMMSPAFFTYVPAISVLLVLSLIRQLILLQKGYWTVGLRWFDIGCGVASIGLLATMLFGPALINFDADMLARLGWGIPSAEQMELATDALVKLSRMVLGVAIAGHLIDIGQQIYRIFTVRASLNHPVTQ